MKFEKEISRILRLFENDGFSDSDLDSLADSNPNESRDGVFYRLTIFHVMDKHHKDVKSLSKHMVNKYGAFYFHNLDADNPGDNGDKWETPVNEIHTFEVGSFQSATDIFEMIHRFHPDIRGNLVSVKYDVNGKPPGHSVTDPITGETISSGNYPDGESPDRAWVPRINGDRFIGWRELE